MEKWGFMPDEQLREAIIKTSLIIGERLEDMGPTISREVFMLRQVLSNQLVLLNSLARLR